MADAIFSSERRATLDQVIWAGSIVTKTFDPTVSEPTAVHGAFTDYRPFRNVSPWVRLVHHDRLGSGNR
jgi:hypothetical protein